MYSCISRRFYFTSLFFLAWYSLHIPRPFFIYILFSFLVRVLYWSSSFFPVSSIICLPLKLFCLLRQFYTTTMLLSTLRKNSATLMSIITTTYINTITRVPLLHAPTYRSQIITRQSTHYHNLQQNYILRLTPTPPCLWCCCWINYNSFFFLIPIACMFSYIVILIIIQISTLHKASAVTKDNNINLILAVL